MAARQRLTASGVRAPLRVYNNSLVPGPRRAGRGRTSSQAGWTVDEVGGYPGQASRRARSTTGRARTRRRRRRSWPRVRAASPSRGSPASRARRPGVIVILTKDYAAARQVLTSVTACARRRPAGPPAGRGPGRAARRPAPRPRCAGRHLRRLQRLPHRRERGLAEHGGAVGRRVAVELGAERVEVDVGSQRGVGRGGAQDVGASGGVRRRHVDQPLEAAGPQQRGVDQLGPVRRADHDDVAQRLRAVQLGEQGGDDAVGDPGVRRLAAARRQRVDLVEEHERGSGVRGSAEQLADRPLGLAHVLVEQLGALDGEHVELAGAGERAQQERLAAAGRAVDEHAARRRRRRAGRTSRGSAAATARPR